MASPSARARDILIENGAAGAGVCEVKALRPFLTPRMETRMIGLPFTPVTAIVSSFPLFSGSHSPGNIDGNIAQYARVPDYHSAVFKRNDAAASAMRRDFPSTRFHPLKNGWPLPIVEAARLSGVTFTGRHGMAIDGKYGSYIALTAVLCDAPLPVSEPAGRCSGCGDGPPACEAACPVGAASWDGRRRVLDRDRCLSHITQTPDQPPHLLETLKLSPYIWGCDLCQRACPHNQNAAVTPLPEFLSSVISNLTRSDIGPSFPSGRHYSGKMDLIERNMNCVGLS